MPVRRVGKGCYQWGHHGKIYCGPGARAKAERQGRAAYAHGYLGEGSGDTSFGDIARKRVSQQLAEEQIVETRTVPIRTTPTFTEDWVLFVTRGKNLSGLEAGRVLIDIDPRLDGEPLAGLLWAFENGRPTITHVWVDPDVQHRGVGRLLIDAYKRFVSKHVIMIGPFSAAGRSFAQRSGAEIVEERQGRATYEHGYRGREMREDEVVPAESLSPGDVVRHGYHEGDPTWVVLRGPSQEKDQWGRSMIGFYGRILTGPNAGKEGMQLYGPGGVARVVRETHAKEYRGREMRNSDDDGFSTLTLWRAAHDDYIPDAASFARKRKDAEAYFENENFGGERLFRTRIEVPDEAVLNLYYSRDPVEDLAQKYDIQNPGAIGVEEWIPRSVKLQDLLRSDGFDWIIVNDSFPQGAETWLWIGPFEREPELEEVD